ncbi:hypothetical protein OG589_44730 [Sphaerisporangium sp. NBC_01403]|uniref:hypothetical protein n=1 Tax=Sphaerisporangium sp. NBC_01403 TaxID=2903599 RepID=UPI00324CF245
MSVLQRPRRSGMRAHGPLLAAVAVSGVAGVVALAGLLVDDRVLTGEPIWLKPFKFSVSVALYAATLAWMLSHLRRGRRWGRWLGTVIAAMVAGELVLITVQAFHGRMSHFNVQTPLDRLVWNGMTAMVVTLWVANLVIAVLLVTQRFEDLAMASAIRLGTVVSLAGMALGFSMTTSTPALDSMRRGVGDGITGAHSVGVPDGGPGLPVVGWSTSGGDLRVAHFLGIHALQAIPLLAVALGALALRTAWLRPERVRVRLVRIAAGTYAGVAAVAAWQALRGQPLTRPDAATLVTFVTLLEMTAAAAAVVLWMGRRDAAGAPTSAPEETICPSTPPSVTASSSAGER